MPDFIRGKVSIRYAQRGSGFPLLLLPPGGMSATMAYWGRSAFNPIEIFASEYRVVSLDQRNAGDSTGPLDIEDPWGSYAQDQLGLMNHLGIQRFHVLGCCIGCSYALNLARLAPDRVVSAVLEQPIGINEENRKLMDSNWMEWAAQLVKKRDDLDMPALEAFCRRMRAGDFVLSVTRDFVRSCRAPLLVLPGIDLPHPTATGREIAELAPKAEKLEPWKEPSDLVPGAVERIRQFLRSHTPR